MEGGRVYGGSNMTVLLQNESLHCSSEVLDSLWISKSSPLHGSTSMVNFKDTCTDNTTNMPICQTFDKRENCNDNSDGCFHQPEKKRRLKADQVLFLERSFEIENKLEPERKVQLAKDLGLQPRQVAIWFQNRRARYKTKLLEKDYDSLKQSYDKLKADYEGLLKENEKLKNDVHLLTDKLLVRDKREARTETCDPSYLLDPKPDTSIPNAASQKVSDLPVLVCKQEDAASSAKSDLDSPRYTDGNHSSLLEPADSSHVFEREHQSDFSQDEEDDVRRLLPFPCFPKIEEVDMYYDDPTTSSCNLGRSVEDQAFRFWSY